MNKYEILHCHTTYSNASTIDSTLSVQSLANRIKEIGGTALCITEHGNMLSKFDANIIAKKNGLKFIQGCEFYFVKDRLAETEGKTIDKKTKLPVMIKDGTNSHMIMLAKNQNGIIAMNRLMSYANIDGFYYKPRIDFDLINKFVNEEDVIITTACFGSFVNKYGFDIINEFDRFIKAGNFFLEIQAHNTKEQKEFNKKLVALAKEKNIPLTFGTDTHAITEDDELYRDLLLKRKNIVYDDEHGWYLDLPTLEEARFRLFEQGILSEDEIKECLNNTNKIVESISNYDISEYHLRVPVPKKYKEFDIEKRFEILKDIVYTEFNKYCEIDEYAKTNRLKYIEEIEYELNEIHGCSMQDYFLLNYEIIKRGKELGGKLTYTSRGSAPCYITNKFLGFTSIDRLQFNLPLIPQRFMTKERILLSHTSPDIDMNVENAEPFIEATRELLGATNAYPMIALGRVQEKTGWKIYAGVNSIPIEVANEVSKSIDEYLTAKKYAGDDSDDIELEDYIPEQYIKEFNNSIHFRSVIENIKPHPCGTLVSPDDLIDNVGLIKIKDKICVAIEGSTAEKLGYLKEDFLIVSVVSIIDKIYKKIGIEQHSTQELVKLCENNQKVWDIYELGYTAEVNQFTAPRTKQMMEKYKPKSITDLSSAVSFIRPGSSSIVNKLVDREPFKFGIKEIDDILFSHTGIGSYVLYQESIMEMLNYAGIDKKETYSLLKSISKKRLDVIKAAKETFIEGVVKRIMEDSKDDI